MKVIKTFYTHKSLIISTKLYEQISKIKSNKTPPQNATFKT